MSTIVTRAGKGSALTWAEGDANFTNLNNDKYQSGASPTFVTADITTANVTTANVTTLNVTTAAITTLGVTTANITTANITTAAVTTLSVAGNNISAVSGLGFRNRIINGNMRVDQRFVGTVQSIAAATTTYILDRWFNYGQAADGVFSVQQLSTGSPPAGYTHYMRFKTTTADASIGAAQLYMAGQKIEGNNIADLDFGLSTAKAITLSFWVRSTLTGTFGGSIGNNNNRNYVFSYVINAANTWEQKTITIAGDTTGTYATDTNVGLALVFDLGVGSNSKGAANTWGSTYYYGVTGGTNLIGTLNATLDLAGVQLEAGSVATPFEQVPFPEQLRLCQRYYQKTFPQATVPAQAASVNGLTLPVNVDASTTAPLMFTEWRYAVCLRASPGTKTTYNPTQANVNWRNSGGTADYTYSDGGADENHWVLRAANVAIGNGAYINATVDAEL